METIIEENTEKFHQFITQKVLSSAFWDAFDDLSYKIKKNVTRPSPSAGSIWDSITITPFFNSCRELVEKELNKQAGYYSAVRWLWYFRLLPKIVFEGKLGSTYGYDTVLAETITGLGAGTRLSPKFRDIFTNYYVNDSIIKNILKFCMGVIFLSQIHTLLRLAGKGVGFFFEKGNALPQAKETKEQVEAINLYDKRVDKGGRPLNRVGTVVSSSALNTTSSESERDSSILVAHLSEPHWNTVAWGPPSGKHQRVKVYQKCQGSFISLNELKKLNNDPRLVGQKWWRPEAGALLLLLKIAISILVHYELTFASVTMFGYFIVPEDIFKTIVNARLSEATTMLQDIIPNMNLPSSADELLGILESISGSLWPLQPNSPIRRAEGIICGDLCSATMLLDHLFEFPKVSDKQANARAEHFELTVQSVVDSSPWCPSPDIRALRGRDLKFNGKKVTDLDAVGTYGDTLLIISCKSLIYSSAYDIGDYVTIRNAATTVSDAVNRWNNEVKVFLESNPKGDNYDFTKYRRLIAVVCTPHPIYVSIGQGTQFIEPELMAASSLSELSIWLNRRKG